MRKARRLGFDDIDLLIQLSVRRGCRHYQQNGTPSDIQEPSFSKLSQDELVVLLLHGNNRNEPMAIRCAAQLLKSQFISPIKVTALAIQERCETPLKYIAQQGLKHDPEGHDLWITILNALGDRGTSPQEGKLPHPSRFMINPGIQRGGILKPLWLTPLEAIDE